MPDPLHIKGLIGDAIIAAFVWLYWRRRTYPVSNRYSTFWPRFWSGSVDTCVLWPLRAIAFLLVSLNPPAAIGALVLLVQQLAWLVYVVLMHGKYGQTVGKMVTKVRVFDARTEKPISYRQALIREGVPTVLSIPFLIYEAIAIIQGRESADLLLEGKVSPHSLLWWFTVLPILWSVVEVVTMLTNDKRRALHDFIAGTVVIRTNATDPVEGGILG